MKKTIKKILLEKNIYYHFKYSIFFRLYQQIFKRQIIKAEKKEIAFYKSFLPASSLIFDIGAYDGHKAAAFLHIAEKVVCLEPDPCNFILLKARFRSQAKRVFLENKAVSNVAGKGLMHVHYPASAFNTLSDEWKNILEKDNGEKWNEKISFDKKVAVATITLDELIEKYGVPEFIKIDVEGFEEKVLQGLSQKIHFLSFEALLPDGSGAINNCLAVTRRLDPSAMFNVAEHEQLLFENFISIKKLEEWLDQQLLTHFEVIVKMNM
ncbi:MAG: FkbM family methyltransferase [Chitinophagaceae bacterium]